MVPVMLAAKVRKMLCPFKNFHSNFPFFFPGQKCNTLVAETESSTSLLKTLSVVFKEFAKVIDPRF